MGLVLLIILLVFGAQDKSWQELNIEKIANANKGVLVNLSFPVKRL